VDPYMYKFFIAAFSGLSSWSLVSLVHTLGKSGSLTTEWLRWL